jgi:hypothetical protein
VHLKTVKSLNGILKYTTAVDSLLTNLKTEAQLRTIKTHEGADIYDIVVDGDDLFSIGSDKRVVQTNLKVVTPLFLGCMLTLFRPV